MQGFKKQTAFLKVCDRVPAFVVNMRVISDRVADGERQEEESGMFAGLSRVLARIWSQKRAVSGARTYA